MELLWNSKYASQKDNISDKKGVYMITVLLQNQKYMAIYVGKAENIKARINEHFSESETNNKLKEYLTNNYTFKIYYAEVGKEEERRGVERYLFDKLKTKFNTNTPPSDTPIKVNLPLDLN